MSKTRPTPSSNPLASFRLDVAYSRIAPAFADAGIETVLLKGPAFDQLLFDGRRAREYGDIDLLVDPVRVVSAERVLEQLGFRRAEREPVMVRLGRRAGIIAGVLRASHGTPWVRVRDQFTVDLHHTLPQVGVSPEHAWRVLSDHRATITVVGAVAQTLDRPASALLIALHAAHHGPGWYRARIDLTRACEVLDRDCWHAAAVLARQLRAEAAIGIGLGTVEAGCAVARELGLRTRPTATDRLRWWGVAWTQRRRRR